MSDRYRKNIEKVSSMLDGKGTGKIQSGYTPTEEKHEIGDIWTDSDDIKWEQKKGYKIRINNAPNVGIADKCNTCESFILKSWDKDTYKADGRCYHCQLNYELDLKFDAPIRWFAYRRLKDFQNMISIENDMIQWIDELEKERQKNPFDLKVANALANGEIEMSVNKVTNKLV